MDPFNFADALLGILAQRLAKRLCSKCKKAACRHGRKRSRCMLTEYCVELANLPKAGRKIRKQAMKVFTMNG